MPTHPLPDNPLKKLAALGQSVWLDYIRRDLIRGGRLQSLIDDDGLRGMTSNPAIFERAIAQSQDYDAEIHALGSQCKCADEIYDALSIRDVQDAADVFRKLYVESEGGDGYVSLEVNPHLAHDTQGTIDEARRLWAALDRPNVLIKVPATLESLPAITQLIGEGINVNVTLLFSVPRYRHVAEAYLAGLESRAQKNLALAPVASVASFFVSRIDVLVDSMLEKIAIWGGKDAETARNLRGKAAIASAKMAYQTYKELFNGPRFKHLSVEGARPQRLLWASTGTKNPDYSDIKYVESLIGAQTVNTVPMETLDAYREHGDPQPRLETYLAEAESNLAGLSAFGIDLDAVTRRLENEGVTKFNEPYEKLMGILASKSTAKIAVRR